MGSNPPSLPTALDILKSSDIDFLVVKGEMTYCAREVLSHTSVILSQLLTCYGRCKNIPEEFSAKIQEHQYWLKLELDYKGKRRMEKKDYQ